MRQRSAFLFNEGAHVLPAVGEGTCVIQHLHLRCDVKYQVTLKRSLSVSWMLHFTLLGSLILGCVWKKSQHKNTRLLMQSPEFLAVQFSDYCMIFETEVP